jgi:hypothetical protein
MMKKFLMFSSFILISSLKAFADSINPTQISQQVSNLTIQKTIKDFTQNIVDLSETVKDNFFENDITTSEKVRETLSKLPFSGHLLNKIQTLKRIAWVKSAVYKIPVIGNIIGIIAETYYDISETQVLEKLAKFQERLSQEYRILGKQVSINTEKIAQITVQLATIGKQINLNAKKIKKLALNQQQMAVQLATIADSLKTINTQIAEIKQGIFLAGLQMLRNYFLTGDLDYLTTAINDLTMARKVKNPQLEPIITLYLINAYAEKIDKEGNKKEAILVREEFQHLANIVDEKNINLLFTAYSAIQDIPFEGKKEILRRAVLKVINQKLENHLYDDALQLAKTYTLLTHDDSIYTYAYQKRLENYNQHKDFKNPQQALEVVDKYQNALLVKEAIKYLYKNNYFDLALKVLNSKDPQDEAFQMATYLSISYYLGDLQKAKQLINLVEENPTYQPTTKKAVLEIKKKYERSLNELKRLKSKEAFDIKDLVSF